MRFPMMVVHTMMIVLWTLPGWSTVSATVVKPRQYIVVVDVSASRKPKMIEEERDFLGQMVDRLTFGEQLVVLQAQQEGLNDHPLRWRKSLPTVADPTFVSSLDRERLTIAKKGIRSALPSFFDTNASSKVEHTDLLATMVVVDEFSRDSAGRSTVLVLLSDMLQSTAKGFEMEHGSRMPPPGWIDRQKRYGLMPQLRGACVVAIGADAASEEGIKVRTFWIDYFSASGARLRPRNYRSTAPSLEAGVCSEGEGD